MRCRNNSWCDLVTQCQNEGLSPTWISDNWRLWPQSKWKIYNAIRLRRFFFLFLFWLWVIVGESGGGFQMAPRSHRWPGRYCRGAARYRENVAPGQLSHSAIMERIFPIFEHEKKWRIFFLSSLSSFALLAFLFLYLFIWHRIVCWQNSFLTLNEMVNLLTYIIYFWLKFNVV